MIVFTHYLTLKPKIRLSFIGKIIHVNVFFYS
jgi:hypothetical protein